MGLKLGLRLGIVWVASGVPWRGLWQSHLFLLVAAFGVVTKTGAEIKRVGEEMDRLLTRTRVEIQVYSWGSSVMAARAALIMQAYQFFAHRGNSPCTYFWAERP